MYQLVRVSSSLNVKRSLMTKITDSYVFPFEPNPDWSTFYAGSPEIWQYMKDTAVKWELEQFIQYNSRVTDSIWDEDSGKWRLKINQQGLLLDDECDVLVNATGFLRLVTVYVFESC
jgi:cation diffusion facilitator CzcD-associated flavoprotein CzcO